MSTVPSAHGLLGVSRGPLRWSEVGPPAGGGSPHACGHPGAHVFCPGQGPANHLSVSCKTRNVTCIVTALPGGDRQSQGLWEEHMRGWEGDGGNRLWFLSRADDLILQLVCWRANEVKKIRGK